MTIRDIAVAFGFEVDSQSEKKAENSIKGLKNLATKLLGVIGIGFSIAGLSNLAETAAEAEALKSQFSQVFGEMEDEAASKLAAIEADTGVMVNRMKGSFTQIAAFSKAAGVEQADALDIANRSMIAVADSAAFYDRSIEQVTDSLQSFLKGNFENDAALGLSCTETTRNAAANNLYGKSFKDLSEAEKQFTLLSMVEEANKASGALGQAARESDTWSNQLGNLKQSVNDLKAAAGNVFLKPAVQVLKLLSTLVQGVTKWLQNMTSETGFLTRSFDRLHALVKRLQPAIDRMAQTLSRGVSRGIDLVKNIVDKFGGIENVLKIAAIAAGAFMAVLAVTKVMSFIKAAGGLASIISKVAKAFSLANLKVMAIIAVIVILALIIEDFINFMKGNDSVIGTLFDKAGIGANNAREAIFSAWQKAVAFLSATWEWIKSTAVYIFETVKTVISNHMGSIMTSMSKIWNGIKTVLSVVWENISGLAQIVFSGLLSFFDGWSLDLEGIFDFLVSCVDGVLQVLGNVGDWISEHKGVMDALVVVLGSIAAAIGIVKGAMLAYNVVSGIVTTVSAAMAGGFGLASAAGGVLAGVMAFLTSPITIAIAAIAALIAIGVLLYKNWDRIKEWALELWAKIKNAFQTGVEAVKGFLDNFVKFFEDIWDGIMSFFQGIWDGIVALVQTYLGLVQAVWQTVWGAISNFFQGIWNGISSFLGGIWSAITGTISNSINNAYSVIQSVLGAIRDFFSNIFNTIASTVTGIFSNILSSISNTIGSIKDTIVNGINAAVDFIKGLPAQAVQWGADFIGGLKDGIMSGVQGIVDAVKGIGDKIRSFLHFSVPDEGPLTDYENWMPDFMSGLAEGISSNEETVLDKVRGLAEGISSLTKAATADVSTATASTVNNNSSSSVTQNVNIANSYTGGTPEVQKNVSKAMKKSAEDATAYMARGLAYARG